MKEEPTLVARGALLIIAIIGRLASLCLALLFIQGFDTDPFMALLFIKPAILVAIACIAGIIQLVRPRT